MSRSRALAFLLVVVALCTGIQGCFFCGIHDDTWGYHRDFAYERPEHTSAGHEHYSRACDYW